MERARKANTHLITEINIMQEKYFSCQLFVSCFFKVEMLDNLQIFYCATKQLKGFSINGFLTVMKLLSANYSLEIS